MRFLSGDLRRRVGHVLSASVSLARIHGGQALQHQPASSRATATATIGCSLSRTLLPTVTSLPLLGKQCYGEFDRSRAAIIHMPRRRQGAKMLKSLLKRSGTIGILPGFTPVSQGVNAILVERLCAPELSEAEYQALVKDAAEHGFELTKG